mmetsp:Transcript_13382/g.32221  ORF Transcript_13382/g.32221 Transcript_13382/m.32221 type:complete len:769 (-) Transcript_13382:315-2621(-)
MKVRLRLGPSRKKKKKKSSHAVNKKALGAVSLLLLSLLNVFTFDHITSGWSRTITSLFDQSAVNKACPHNMTVDIISIGSVHRLDYLSAQQTTFASHCTVRNFFTATEKDDADPECESKLSNQTVESISNFCRRGFRWGRKGKWFMEYMAGAYAFHRWLMKKKNPQGWVCAQTRPPQALFNVLGKYKKKNETFPDYLMIIDDDTYYNMKLFSDYFKPMNSSEPIATAGCRVRSPVHRINFTIPFGGYGITVSKGWLEKIVKPISCPGDTEYCNAIQVADHIGEKAVFKNGMTIAELMYGYSNYEPFDQRETWTIGFCLHSDWFIAYFTNFYNISNHVTDPDFVNVPQARLGSIMESEINGGDAPHRRKICDFHSGNCHSMSFACHYSNPTEMKAITDIVRQENPSEYMLPETDCAGCDEDEPYHQEKAPIVDIISLVRNSGTANIDAQKRVIGSDESVRFFFNISEFNTDDPSSCSNDAKPITMAYGNKIAFKCKSDQLHGPEVWLMDRLRGHYSRYATESVPQWFCEQRRLIKGVSRLLLQYQQQSGKMELPDYLMLVTDTTYFNVKVFREMLRNIAKGVKSSTGKHYNPSEDPLAVGGCMRDYGISSGVSFRVPRLDFGIILNRATLEGLLKQIHCGKSENEKNPLCNIISESQVGEKDVFKDGMTPVDLMSTFALANAHNDFKNWTIGMCFEAEWLLAYFIQFYTGTKTTTIPPESSLARANSSLHPYLEPIQNTLCQYSGPDCNIDAPFCSEISADQMLTYMRN